MPVEEGIPGRKIGRDPLRERLYRPGGSRGHALQTLGMFQRVRRMEIIGKTMADDRVLRQVLIAFRDEGRAFVIEDPKRLQEIIVQLVQLHDNWTAKGQSKVVTMVEEQ